ncbi:MAG: hypothetical protein HYV63_28220 [Candidatus Schekmanbacteria bacterium]|nr:hypothetical protein [Candidatus Schekmanbacteria bacterium]
MTSTKVDGPGTDDGHSIDAGGSAFALPGDSYFDLGTDAAGSATAGSIKANGSAFALPGGGYVDFAIDASGFASAGAIGAAISPSFAVEPMKTTSSPRPSFLEQYRSLDEMPEDYRNALETFGWRDKNWNTSGETPKTWEKTWKKLNRSEKRAAEALGYDKESWGKRDFPDERGLEEPIFTTAAKVTSSLLKPRGTSLDPTSNRELQLPRDPNPANKERVLHEIADEAYAKHSDREERTNHISQQTKKAADIYARRNETRLHDATSSLIGALGTGVQAWGSIEQGNVSEAVKHSGATLGNALNAAGSVAEGFGAYDAAESFERFGKGVTGVGKAGGEAINAYQAVQRGDYREATASILGAGAGALQAATQSDRFKDYVAESLNRHGGKLTDRVRNELAAGATGVLSGGAGTIRAADKFLTALDNDDRTGMAKAVIEGGEAVLEMAAPFLRAKGFDAKTLGSVGTALSYAKDAPDFAKALNTLFDGDAGFENRVDAVEKALLIGSTDALGALLPLTGAVSADAGRQIGLAVRSGAERVSAFQKESQERDDDAQRMTMAAHNHDARFGRALAAYGLGLDPGESSIFANLYANRGNNPQTGKIMQAIYRLAQQGQTDEAVRLWETSRGSLRATPR